MKLYVNESILIVTLKVPHSVFFSMFHYFMNFDALVANKGVISDFPCEKFLFYN